MGRPGEMNRRAFLIQGAAATATLLAARGLAEEAATKGPTVVVIRDKAAKVIDGFNVDATIVQRLVDKAVMALAGKDDVAKAWGMFVAPKDRVAVKFNGLFARATTHPEVIIAVTSGLVRAGVSPANIVVYDRSDKDFATTGLQLNRDGEGVRMYPTREYGADVKAGPVGTKLSKILLDADVIVNVPMMKSHHRCAITGALKNHLGSVPNAGAYHDNFCAAIADLNALVPIKDKTRICIADALYGLYDAGPGFSPKAKWDYCGVLAATDPVAIDAVMDDIVMAKRIEKGLKPRHESNLHITRAAELGLGEADPKKINRVEVEI